MKQVLTDKQVAQALNSLYRRILANCPAEGRIAIIGIRTRGQVLAQRLAGRLRRDRPGLPVDAGVLDITFYRDDLSRGGVPRVRATEISFNLDDAWVLLVDDVLQTGRSVRAALDALTDFGRPRVIRLAVLLDRGGRELPIAADFVGKKLQAPDAMRVQLRLKENDGQEGVFITPKG
jgi:pyrimidine operon attenuation protein/uracil phosphoribosyltransferase